MITYSIEEVVTATNGKIINIDEASGGEEINNVVIDSRKVEPGSLFVALPGEKTDGHLFIEKALQLGASAAIVSKEVKLSENITKRAIIKVQDTLIALQDLARYHRTKFSIPLVGVTGSCGKTTTKDMIAAVLSENGLVLKTEGNYNNEIGLPLTLLKLTAKERACVLEMGMRGLGEIKQLVDIAKPNIGVITNIGSAHIEILGSKDNIAIAKGELIEGLPQNGVAILNGEDEYCQKIGSNFVGEKIYYGFNENCDIIAQNIETTEFSTSFRVKWAGGSFNTKIPLPGNFNVLNSLAAIAVGLEMGLKETQIQDGLANLELTKMRLEPVKGKKGELLINDTYNANPDSMIASLKILNNLNGIRKIAVLGDMYELGAQAESGHREVGAVFSSLELDILVTIGGLASHIADSAKEQGFAAQQCWHFNNNQEATEFLEKIITEADVVLIKGSRGMKMEEIINKLAGS
ncbi:MAG: UDP-N-acetylmuramoyl-tripeptide--D-alanyl-D-alanine ligase [Bacillota bacterium]|nr:UDP-N-acetylmuramoyl-tripeptide--D-alanyl-D-alanine ligase [Bacillota bacterium]